MGMIVAEIKSRTKVHKEVGGLCFGTNVSLLDVLNWMGSVWGIFPPSAQELS